jgi:8-oxo-dGTP pyrophosphatase MutT (NUDIX family)
MFKNNTYCNNCGKNGHFFQQCKQPITSVGILAFRYNNKSLQYLMIRRKDTIGYIEFIRGKYPLHNKQYLKTIIDEMTLDEKNKIINSDFDTLWNDLWGDHVNAQYKCEEKSSKEKYETLKNGLNFNGNIYSLTLLVNDSETKWIEPEWGFPKGRHNYQEKDLICAFREFEEETGYLSSSLKLIQNIIPFEEIFIGSNYKSYKHKYFIAKMENFTEPINKFQQSEVSKVEWKSYDNTMESIRPYSLEKKDVISRVNKLLLEYRLYP